MSGHAERTPIYVLCPDCQHSWIGFYTPIPVTDFAKIFRGLRCPMCASKKISLKMAEQDKERREPLTAAAHKASDDF